MRVLIATFAEKTHFLGMAPLGWALRNEGHEVLVASQPELTPVIAATGLTAAPVGRDHLLPQVAAWARRLGQGGEPAFDLLAREPERLTWEHLQRGYREALLPLWWKVINESMMTELTEFCRWWRPHLVIWEPLTYAAPVAARACGAAHGRLLFGLDLAARLRGHYLRLMAGRTGGDRTDAMASWLGSRAARHGGLFSESLTRGDFTLDYMPDSLRLDTAPGVRRLPMRFVPYNGRAVVPDWLRVPPDRPRVCLSLGSTATDRLGGYVAPVSEVMEALADLPVEIVATLPPGRHTGVGTAPDNVKVVGYTPLHVLAPTCAAVINHGGSGTICSTLLYGVPQLVLPHHMFDEPLLADLLVKQGAGLAVPAGERDTPERTRAALQRMLAEPSFSREAARLSGEMRAMPGPNELVPELERLAARAA